MLLSQPDYTHSFKRKPQLLIPLFKNQWYNSMEIDAGTLLDRTRVMYHRRIDYNTICKSCTIVVK